MSTPRSCSAAALLNPSSSDGVPATSAKFRTCSAVNDNARPSALLVLSGSLGRAASGALWPTVTSAGVMFSVGCEVETEAECSWRGSWRKRKGGGVSWAGKMAATGGKGRRQCKLSSARGLLEGEDTTRASVAITNDNQRQALGICGRGTEKNLSGNGRSGRNDPDHFCQRSGRKRLQKNARCIGELAPRDRNHLGRRKETLRADVNKQNVNISRPPRRSLTTPPRPPLPPSPRSSSSNTSADVDDPSSRLFASRRDAATLASLSRRHSPRTSASILLTAFTGGGLPGRWPAPERRASPACSRLFRDGGHDSNPPSRVPPSVAWSTSRRIPSTKSSSEDAAR